MLGKIIVSFKGALVFHWELKVFKHLHKICPFFAKRWNFLQLSDDLQPHYNLSIYIMSHFSPTSWGKNETFPQKPFMDTSIKKSYINYFCWVYVFIFFLLCNHIFHNSCKRWGIHTLHLPLQISVSLALSRSLLAQQSAISESSSELTSFTGSARAP